MNELIEIEESLIKTEDVKNSPQNEFKRHRNHFKRKPIKIELKYSKIQK
jgi:hypothetical protein